jgi:pimeloyl-ACP methyl ester carboxylesterase
MSAHAGPGSAAAFVVATPDGAALPVYAFGGPAQAPALLFGHANGLAAGSYAPWLDELAGTLRVFAFDARGHGASRWPKGAIETVFAVDRFADDLALIAAAVAARLERAPLHYAGHSLNAAAALRLAARGAPLPWSGTLLFEPPVFPPMGSPHHAEAVEKQMPLVTRSAARRALWPNPPALAELLRARRVCALPARPARRAQPGYAPAAGRGRLHAVLPARRRVRHLPLPSPGRHLAAAAAGARRPPSRLRRPCPARPRLGQRVYGGHDRTTAAGAPHGAARRRPYDALRAARCVPRSGAGHGGRPCVKRMGGSLSLQFRPVR